MKYLIFLILKKLNISIKFHNLLVFNILIVKIKIVLALC
jgi:hypothetical protein